MRTILRRSSRPVATVNPAVATPTNTPAVWALDEARRKIRLYSKLLELSRYEYGVLRLPVQKTGSMFTRDELLLQVWGGDNDSFDRTVDAHIKTLRAKLKLVASGHDPIRTLRGSSYALSEKLPKAL